MTSPDEAPVRLARRDRAYLERAVVLGRRGWGRVSPNPMVGCVLVRGNEVIGEGWHAEYGGPHAEVAALAAAGATARGSEAFVSLEPCRHHGKTPPCTRALREAGVARVVYGAPDPGPDSGGGGRELAEGGVEVLGPALSWIEARWENPVFFHSVAERPWIALKLALSLDARIAARDGVRTQLSGPETTAEVHRLRAGFDGILVGTRTLFVDDPRLTARGEVRPRLPPRRIVLDATGRLEPGARLFEEPAAGEVWILTTAAAPDPWRARMEQLGARVIQVEEDRSGRIRLAPALLALRMAGVRSLLCEGGGVLAASLIEAGVIDRLHLLYSPRLLGMGGVPAFPSPVPVRGEVPSVGIRGASMAWRIGEGPRRLGEDCWLALEPSPTTGGA